jgi:uncharacterized membrane protein
MTRYSESTTLTLLSCVCALAVAVMMLSLGFNFAWALIYMHVALGFLAFAVGAVTLFSKKGKTLHKNTGLVFYYSMVVSVALSLVVSLLPEHLSPTMFHIAVLSLYFLLGGKRSLKFKTKNHNFNLDKTLAYWVVLTSLAVMGYTFFVEGRVHPLRTVFGTIGLVFGALDLWMFRSPDTVSRKWLFLHLSKMLGGYTAAVTAFFVAQNILSGYFNWFVPAVFAVAFILYWAYKLRLNRASALPAK